MLKEGSLIQTHHEKSQWFHLANENRDRVDQRLAELQPIWSDFTHGKTAIRTGQALEIAVFRALRAAQINIYGGYSGLDDHDDATRYSKTELYDLNGGSLGKQALDFVIGIGTHHVGIEVKNVRPWFYAHDDEIQTLLRKALTLRVLPVLIARRIQYSAFRVLGTCGLIIHETYNQRMATADASLAAKARDKHLLGYHDIRLGNQPDARLTRFVGTNLPTLLDEAAAKIERYHDLLTAYAHRDMGYREFSARVRRRDLGLNEDSDSADDRDPEDFDPRD